jgi:nitrogen fixation/metabolism regulation signal transduction histidine kinase
MEHSNPSTTTSADSYEAVDGVGHLGNTELSDSEKMLEGILASAMDAIITVDSRQLIRLFNTAAERMFGYSRAEIAGQSLGCCFPTVTGRRMSAMSRTSDVPAFQQGTWAARGEP